MQDYFVCREDGSESAVAEMPTAEILDMLAGDRTVEPRDGYPRELIIERLKIELIAREIEGRR